MHLSRELFLPSVSLKIHLVSKKIPKKINNLSFSQDVLHCIDLGVVKKLIKYLFLSGKTTKNTLTLRNRKLASERLT